MGITLNKILSDIRNIATSGANAINFRITDNQITYWIHQTRETLINQDIQKRKDLSDTWLQSLTCVDLVEVDKSECCEITTNCKILRTVRQLPDTIETNADNYIVRVESPNGDIISKTTPFESKYIGYSKYVTEKSRWYLKNNYLYIINEDYLDKVNIWGIFSNPEDLISFASCDGTSCFSINGPYPCSGKMASVITDIILKTKIYPFLQTPRDTSNDSNDNFDSSMNIKNQ